MIKPSFKRPVINDMIIHPVHPRDEFNVFVVQFIIYFNIPGLLNFHIPEVGHHQDNTYRNSEAHSYYYHTAYADNLF